MPVTISLLSSLILCLCVSFVSHSLLFNLPEPPIFVCVQSLVVSLPAPLFFPSLPLPVAHNLQYVSVTCGRLVDCSFSSHPLTSIYFPSLLLTNPPLRTAFAVSLPLKKVKKKRALAVIEEISVFCQDWPYKPEALHIISKTEATQS